MDDTTLRRRDFLARTASAAGLAGLASLPAGTLVAEAARAQARRLPSPRNLPLDHVVVVMMENRSFDHYFGWLDARRRRAAPALRRRRDRRAGRHPPRVVARGRVAGLRASRSRPRLGGRPQPAARRLPRRGQRQRSVRAHLLRRGRDRVPARGGRASTRCTTASSARCSARRGRTGTTSGRRSPAGARTTTRRSDTLGNQWETIFDRALANGVSAQYYNSDLPFSAVWGARGVPWTRPLAQYYADCARGTLPNVTLRRPAVPRRRRR